MGIMRDSHCRLGHLEVGERTNAARNAQVVGSGLAAEEHGAPIA